MSLIVCREGPLAKVVDDTKAHRTGVQCSYESIGLTILL